MAVAIDDESPFERGMEAYREGISLSRNPYQQGEEEFYVWIDGYQEASTYDDADEDEFEDWTDDVDEDDDEPD